MPANHQYAGIPASNTIKTVDDAVFDSFETCSAFARTHEPSHRVDIKHRRWNIASNVKLRFVEGRGEDYFAIVLYQTEIVRYYKDGTFSVDNGGFTTLTTAKRVSQFTPYGYQGYHSHKKLILNGDDTGHEIRFPNVHASRSN